MPRWRPPRIAVALGLAGLLAGLAAGYAAGVWHSGKAAPARSRPAAAAHSVPPFTTSGSPLAPLGPECAVQTGHDLQLGVQLTNDSAAPVTVLQVDAVLPAGGLKPVSWAWGPCGELPTAVPDQVLASGDSIWFTMTFQVLVSCPGPLPVQFDIGYSQSSRRTVASVAAFPDLGQVQYSGCQ
jgi:hypothetical protein